MGMWYISMQVLEYTFLPNRFTKIKKHIMHHAWQFGWLDEKKLSLGCWNTKGKSCMHGSKAHSSNAHCTHFDPQIHRCWTYSNVARYIGTFVLALAVPQLDSRCPGAINTLADTTISRAWPHHAIVIFHWTQTSSKVKVKSEVFDNKSKGLDNCCSAAYMCQTRDHRALQSSKWQLIGMSGS